MTQRKTRFSMDTTTFTSATINTPASQVAAYSSSKEATVTLLQLPGGAWKVQEVRKGISNGSTYRGPHAAIRARVAYDVRVAL